jgi:hypothetical protein
VPLGVSRASFLSFMSHSLSHREAIRHRADNFVFRSVGGARTGILPRFTMELTRLP